MKINDLARSAWTALPHAIRDTPLLSYSRRKARKLLQSDNISPTRFMGRTSFPPIIENLSELDEAIEYASYLERHDQDAFFRFITAISVKAPAQTANLDPFTDQYRHEVQQAFQWLSGHNYNVRNEALQIYVNETIRNPYPYSTKSSEIVGKQLIFIGSLIKALKAKPGMRILEMGPGHGNLTIPLTQLGCEVTSVDISQRFLEVVKIRLRQVGKRAKLLNCDFLDIDLNSEFDAIVFNASFHHCSDHSRLISNLNKIIAPGGKIYFCNEPIGDFMPVPWGLRLDGESAFHIRLHGWLELGFQETYFNELMYRHGWVASKIQSSVGTDVIFQCSRHNSGISG